MQSRLRATVLSGGAAAVLSVASGPLEADDQAPITPPRPEGLPDAASDWRENFTRLADATAASPLPTRQLRRMAARALSRTLSHAQGSEERKQRKLTKKRNRAIAATEKHRHGSGSTV